MTTAPWSALMLNDRYRLEEQVATGGMGEVWRARDVLLDRTVAVKLLRREYADDAGFRARLRQEAQHAGLLAHPGVVRVYDYADGSAEDVPYLVMEYVDGPSLAEVLNAEGILEPHRVLELLAEVAEALYCAHSAGLVHRDVKPANLLMCGDQIKIVDFGLARAMDAVSVTRSGLVMGTPLYMSPEQVIGTPATYSSDLYALGVIAYECLTGRPPFEGEAMAIAVAHRDRPLPPLPETVPAPVAELVRALTAKDPVDRPGDGRIVAGWARNLLDDSSAGPPETAVQASLAQEAAERAVHEPLWAPAPEAFPAPAPGTFPEPASETFPAPASEVFPAPAPQTVPEAVPETVREPVPGSVSEARKGSGAQHRTALAALLLAVLLAAAAVGWGLSRSSHGGPAATPSQQTSRQSGRIFIDPAAYIGTPAVNAAMQLRGLGLRVQIQTVHVSDRPPGTVTRLTPTGNVQPGALITLYANAESNGQSTNPGTQPSAPSPTRNGPTPAPPTTAPSSPAPTGPSASPSGGTGSGGGGSGGRGHNKKPGHGG